MKSTVTEIKSGQRNPFVIAMRMRKSGVHGKTIKAKRRSDKMSMKKDLNKLLT